jgi:hypothetical protein
MGGMLVTKNMIVPKKEIESILRQIIESNFMSRTEEEDMYRGDFGSTQSIVKVPEDKVHKDYKRMERNHDKFVENTEFEKYQIKYQITGQLNYVDQMLKVEMHASTRGKLTMQLAPPYRRERKEFKNVTELKRYIKDVSNPMIYKNAKIYNHNHHVIGTVETVTKEYKSKPKSSPKANHWHDRYVLVSFGAINPI